MADKSEAVLWCVYCEQVNEWRPVYRYDWSNVRGNVWFAKKKVGRVLTLLLARERDGKR